MDYKMVECVIQKGKESYSFFTETKAQAIAKMHKYIKSGGKCQLVRFIEYIYRDEYALSEKGNLILAK